MKNYIEGKVTKERLELGNWVKDIRTGTEGHLMGYVIFSTGCTNVEISPSDRTKKGLFVSTKRVEFLNKGLAEQTEEKGFSKIIDILNAEYKFGDTVEDIVTGFKGKVVTIGVDLTQPIKYGVEAPYSKKLGKSVTQWVDYNRLKLIKKADGEDIIKIDAEKPNGPAFDYPIGEHYDY